MFDSDDVKFKIHRLKKLLSRSKDKKVKLKAFKGWRDMIRRSMKANGCRVTRRQWLSGSKIRDYIEVFETDYLSSDKVFTFVLGLKVPCAEFETINYYLGVRNKRLKKTFFISQAQTPRDYSDSFVTLRFPNLVINAFIEKFKLVLGHYRTAWSNTQLNEQEVLNVLSKVLDKMLLAPYQIKLDLKEGRLNTVWDFLTSAACFEQSLAKPEVTMRSHLDIICILQDMFPVNKKLLTQGLGNLRK